MTMSSAQNETVVMGTTEGRTPPRNTSSLAHDPISTPIASAKRPRGSSSRMVLATPDQGGSTLSIESPSPMHTAKPVHREAIEEEIKDIFSPVAHFLHEAESEDESIAQPHIAEDDEFNPWTFIQTLPPYETLQPNPVTLPPSSVNKKSLVLDLDETLVHCSVDVPETPADLTFPVVFHGNNYTVHVKLRPYLQEFLESVSTEFEVIVFTASQKVYADALLDLIDPEGIFIHHRLFRESCLQVEGNFLKDLNVLGRPLEKTLLVDNSPHAFGYQVDNGIPIESWFEDPNDRELRKLEKFLKRLLKEDDVRPLIRKKFQSNKLIKNS